MPALPLHDGPDAPPSRRSRSPLVLLLILPVLAVVHIASPLSPLSGLSSSASAGSTIDWTSTAGGMEVMRAKCPVQGKPLKPRKTLTLPEGYRKESAERLSAAVQIPTISYDDNGSPTEDPRWKPFYDFQDWLEETFPAVFQSAHVTLEKVNHLGILTTVQGSDKTLKPLLLLSHYDVTPAPLETYDRWTHSPFSGFIDDEYVFGRGAQDDKTLLVAQYEALSILLADPSYVPRRTVILSHGFDEEEVFARQGAGQLAPFLEERYGRDSMLLVIDEGTSLDNSVWGAEFAVPATSEKGYLDVKITVGTAGGHSSVPPTHSGIGIMGRITSAIEDNPYPTSFAADDPLLDFLGCAGEYSPKFPKEWRGLLDGGHKGWQKLSEKFGETGIVQHALVSTTQAIDVINGGVKVNSLPEQVSVLMNHRIAFSSNISSVQKHLADTIAPVAKKYDLNLSAFAKEAGTDANEKLGGRYIKIETFGIPLEPAPRSPLSGGVWDLFSGSIKYAFPTADGKDRIVSPFASTGSTDTKVYHPLSRSVFRFMGAAPHKNGRPGNAHTVDEATSIDSHLSIINWIHTIVQNADAYDGEQ